MLADLEGAQVKKVIAALNDRFPQLAEEFVAREVDRHYHSFVHARVRTYIPVLVQHQARETLRLLSNR